MASAAQKAARKAEQEQQKSKKDGNGNGNGEQAAIDAAADKVRALTHATHRAIRGALAGDGTEPDRDESGRGDFAEREAEFVETAPARDVMQEDARRARRSHRLAHAKYGTSAAAEAQLAQMPAAPNDRHGARIIDRPLTSGADG